MVVKRELLLQRSCKDYHLVFFAYVFSSILLYCREHVKVVKKCSILLRHMFVAYHMVYSLHFRLFLTFFSLCARGLGLFCEVHSCDIICIIRRVGTHTKKAEKAFKAPPFTRVLHYLELAIPFEA